MKDIYEAAMLEIIELEEVDFLTNSTEILKD